MNLNGVITALITPFSDGKLDEEGLVHNIRYQIRHGIDGLLVLGSTGEAPTLSAIEQHRIISLAVKEADGNIPIWVGTGSYCTRSTIEKTKIAQDLGADLAMIVTPYYNKPTQEGLFRHFEAIAASVQIPIMIYNIPGRCAANIETATLTKIAELPGIVGVKEASGNLNQVSDVIHAIALKKKNFTVLAGDDGLALPMIAVGAKGIVSVASNLIPHEILLLVRAALEERFNEAREIHHRLLPLFKALFLESNPIPIKAAMHLNNMPAGLCRLPLSPLLPDNLRTIEYLLEQMNLLTNSVI